MWTSAHKGPSCLGNRNGGVGAARPSFSPPTTPMKKLDRPPLDFGQMKCVFLEERRESRPDFNRLQVRPGRKKDVLLLLRPRAASSSNGVVGGTAWRRLQFRGRWAERSGRRGAEVVRPQRPERGSSKASASRASPGPLWPLVSSQEVIQKFLQTAAGACWPGSPCLSQPAWAGYRPSFYLPEASQLLWWPPPHSQLVQGQTVPGNELAGGELAPGPWGGSRLHRRRWQGSLALCVLEVKEVRLGLGALPEAQPGAWPGSQKPGPAESACPGRKISQARQKPGALGQDLSQHPHLPSLRLRTGPPSSASLKTLGC